MGFKTWIAERLARREVAAAREGKRGKEAESVLKVLDGWKRIIMVLFFAAGAVANLMTGQSYENIIVAVTSTLGWDMADAFVNFTQVTAIVGTIWAVVEGLRKQKLMAKGQKGEIPPEDVVFPKPDPKL